MAEIHTTSREAQSIYQKLGLIVQVGSLPKNTILQYIFYHCFTIQIKYEIMKMDICLVVSYKISKMLSHSGYNTKEAIAVLVAFLSMTMYRDLTAVRYSIYQDKVPNPLTIFIQNSNQHLVATIQAQFKIQKIYSIHIDIMYLKLINCFAFFSHYTHAQILDQIVLEILNYLCQSILTNPIIISAIRLPSIQSSISYCMIKKLGNFMMQAIIDFHQ